MVKHKDLSSHRSQRTADPSKHLPPFALQFIKVGFVHRFSESDPPSSTTSKQGSYHHKTGSSLHSLPSPRFLKCSMNWENSLLSKTSHFFYWDGRLPGQLGLIRNTEMHPIINIIPLAHFSLFLWLILWVFNWINWIPEIQS